MLREQLAHLDYLDYLDAAIARLDAELEAQLSRRPWRSCRPSLVSPGAPPKRSSLKIGADLPRLPSASPQPQPHSSVRETVLVGVREQVGQHLGNAHPVHHRHHPSLRRLDMNHGPVQAHLLLPLLPNKLRKISRSELQCQMATLHLRCIHHILHETLHLLDTVIHESQ